KIVSYGNTIYELSGQPGAVFYIIDTSGRESIYQRRVLLGASKAGQHLDAERVIGETLAKSAPMLFGEDRRGHEDGDLLARLHRLECRAHGDLGLSVSDIADEQPVHRAGALHVPFDLVRCTPLVRGVFIKEGGLDLALPRRTV